MRPSKHESVRLKPIRMLRVVSSVVPGADDRKPHYLDTGAWRFRCSIGKAGKTRFKREGDSGTPIGRFAILAWMFRPGPSTRVSPAISWRFIRRDDGWCDDPGSGAYNRPIKTPSRLGHELMWRDDQKYDVVGILEYNLNPRQRRRGSAIFFHLCGNDFESTAGCIAVRKEDMQKILARIARAAFIHVG